MKRLIGNLASVLCCLFVPLVVAHAAPLRDCRVTQVVSDVKLLPEQAAPRPAVINDSVHYGTAVRTGTRSRTELTFVDQTITRLGGDTIFSFKGEPTPPAEGPERALSSASRNSVSGERVMNLVEGAMLFAVPKGHGGTAVKTAAVTAAITGTTGIGEYHASSAEHPKPIIKWFCLEGHIILNLTNGSGETVELTAGQMIVTDGSYLPRPMFFNIGAMVNSSPFFDPPPPSMDLIQAEIERQTEEQLTGGFIQTDTYAALDSSKMVKQIDQGMAAEFSSSTEPPTPTPPTPTPSGTATPPTPTPSTPTPTPSKFGALAVVTSPDPFVIDSDTVINTDPVITKSLTTGFGKIYRTSADDGSRTAWMFGSTSAFDNSSGFDHGADAHFLDNIAGFKFQSLILDSDPIIQTAGGMSNLALIGVDGITMSNRSSETFTFGGIDTLLLATQNGSIDLASGYTFTGINRIYLYARGAGSHLTVDSDISTGSDLRLFSEGAVSIGGTLATVNFSSMSGGDFTNTEGSVTAGGINVTSQDGGITIDTGAFHAGSFSGISLSLTAGDVVDITMGSDLSMFESASSISVSGHEIDLNADDVVTLNLSVTSPAKFTAGDGGINAANISFVTLGGLQLQADGDIDIYGAAITQPRPNGQISGFINAGGEFHAVADVTTGDITAGGSITIDEGNLSAVNVTAGEGIDMAGDISAQQAVSAGSDVFVNSITAGTTVDVGGDLFAAESVTAGGDVNAYGMAVPTVSTPHGVLRVGDDGIFPYTDSPLGADLQHTITADSVVASGGIYFNGNLFGGANGLSHGGLLTINARTVLFDDGSNGIAYAILDGANVGAFNGADPVEAGDGGRLIVNTTGDITMTVDSFIVARTGLTPPDAPFGGVGGEVTFDSSAGTVSVDSLIRVSQATSFESHGEPQRRSATGGNITLHSGLTSGEAIILGENADLESLLHDDAPGVGGTIKIITEGGNIDANGIVIADRGTVTISNGGTGVVPAPRQPGAPLPAITLNGITIVSELLDVSSIGLLNIGLEDTVAISSLTASLHADSDINIGSFSTIGAVRDSTGDVTMRAEGNVNFSGPIDIERLNAAISSGLDLSISAGQNIAGNSFIRLVVDNNSGSNLTSGANLSLTADQLLQASALNLKVDSSGGHIDAGGTISVTANELAAGSIDAVIDSQNGGSIGSGGTIDFNVSNGATVTNNANLQVLGSNTAGGAAININGGDYNVGGTFRAFIDGKGTIAFNNASLHADVLKAGALGANGVLNIGGSTLSADTMLKLYAPGSNGQLNFISDVTLNGNSTKILAASSVTIFDDVVVTVGGNNAADVFTAHANYSEEWGGNSSTTGTFAGAGANAPLPLSSAPAFDEAGEVHPSASGSANPPTSTGGHRGSSGTLIRVDDSGQLLSLLDGTADRPGGKIKTPNPRHRNNPRNSNRSNPAERLNDVRDAMVIPNRSLSRTKTLLP